MDQISVAGLGFIEVEIEIEQKGCVIASELQRGRGSRPRREAPSPCAYQNHQQRIESLRNGRRNFGIK